MDENDMTVEVSVDNAPELDGAEMPESSNTLEVNVGEEVASQEALS